MQIHFVEQDVIDACCVFVAQQNRMRPEDVQVDLQYDENKGFAADAKMGFRSSYLNQQDVIDAIATYLASYHQFDAQQLRVEMVFDDRNGIEADILVM